MREIEREREKRTKERACKAFIYDFIRETNGKNSLTGGMVGVEFEENHADKAGEREEGETETAGAANKTPLKETGETH